MHKYRDSLRGEQNLSDLTLSPSPTTKQIVRYPTDRFYVEKQARTQFDPVKLADREASLRSIGQQQPILVEPADDTGRHRIIDGECRWRAAQRIEEFLLDAVILPCALSSRERLLRQIVANEDHNHLSPMELGVVFNYLYENERMTAADIASAIGWLTRAGAPAEQRVYLYIRISDLPPDVLDLVQRNSIRDHSLIDRLKTLHKRNPEAFATLVDDTKDSDTLTRASVEKAINKDKSKPSSKVESVVAIESSAQNDDEGHDGSDNPKKSEEEADSLSCVDDEGSIDLDDSTDSTPSRPASIASKETSSGPRALSFAADERVPENKGDDNSRATGNRIHQIYVRWKGMQSNPNDDISSWSFAIDQPPEVPAGKVLVVHCDTGESQHVSYTDLSIDHVEYEA